VSVRASISDTHNAVTLELLNNPPIIRECDADEEYVMLGCVFCMVKSCVVVLK
jgi:hypothetical protein